MDCKTYDNDITMWNVPSINNLIDNDLKLKEFERDIRSRYAIYESTKMKIEQSEGMENFTLGYKEYGVIVKTDGSILCREWIPNAKAVYLSGDFNNWEKWAYQRKPYSKWEMTIQPNPDGTCGIHHLSELKLLIETNSNQCIERISPWSKYVVQQQKGAFKWVFWNPPRSEVCIPAICRPPKPLRLRIYEAHIGIASDQCDVSTYRQFISNVLPRIKDLGYNCVLLMAIMEHPDYHSFGYQVSNFFAVSSRYGTPEDLKELINVAHGMGITVMMDVIHSKASNSKYGLNRFDGTDDCYFQKNKRINQQGNEKLTFNLTKWEILRFLLSNLRFFIEEYNLDGYRFNDITTMLYHNHGEHRYYSDDYRQYFGIQMNVEAIAYLMIANDVLHSMYPSIVTVAEDKSEMPTLCRPVREGGVGFDYKLGLSVPNKWMKLLNEYRDEDWNMGFIFHAMVSRRSREKVIACTDTRQQNMQKNHTLISKLTGKELCYNMSDEKPLTSCIDRGLSLYKMIRLMTHSLAGDGYVNFIGNEFGHPDFVELPSFHNNNSYQNARRRFELCDNEQLRFKYLNRFDRALNRAEQNYGWLTEPFAYVSRKHEEDKVFVYERADLLFLFNFHPTRSYPDYRVGIEKAGVYKIILDTDDLYFGGHGRNQASVEFRTVREGFDNRNNSVMVYLPSRCALIMANLQQIVTTPTILQGRPLSGSGSHGYRSRMCSPVHM